MLAKFSVKNFKNFKESFTLDLTQTKQYGFSKDCVKNDIVKTGLIYGPNSIGKSNLGRAIFDIVLGLTDKQKRYDLYLSYQNALAPGAYVEFEYEFHFDQDVVVYRYWKTSFEDFVYEQLLINGQDMISRLPNATTFTSNLDGTESLRTEALSSKISVLRYIRANTMLSESKNNKLFLKTLHFVDNMLQFWCLLENSYQGYSIGGALIEDEIIKQGHLPDLENFLNECDVRCHLASRQVQNRLMLFFDFDNHLLPFWDNASTGTKSLTLFYFWYFHLLSNDAPSFVFIDEFDAFYHEKASMQIIRRLKKTKLTQVLLTTHCSNLLTNDLLRPDCAFEMPKDTGLKPIVLGPLSSKTGKELREAHNIPKMFRAGAFD